MSEVVLILTNTPFESWLGVAFFALMAAVPAIARSLLGVERSD